MPPVLEVFKHQITYIWNVFIIPIDLGNGYKISLWNVTTYVIIFALIYKFILQDITPFGGDRAEKFSGKSNVRIIKKGAMKVEHKQSKHRM